MPPTTFLPTIELEGDHRTTLFIIADDRERIRQRIIRVLDPELPRRVSQVAHRGG